MAKPQEPKPREIDPSILTADEIAELQLEAEAEVLAKAKATAKEQLKKKLVLEAERERGVKEPLVDVYVDLPPYADRITLDNHSYMQGQTYTVRQSVAQVIGEICQKTWAHQSVVDGKSENFYRRARQTHILPGGGVVNGTSNILRA